MAERSSLDIRVEAANAYFGKRHCRKIKTVADTLGSLNGTYFDLNWFDGDFNEIEGYVYFDTDPAIAGKTAIGPVARTDGDSAATIAAAIKTALDASDALVRSTVSGDEVTIENRAPSLPTAETDSGATGFTFTTERAGTYFKLGKTSEGFEVSTETEVIDLVSDQTGTLILGQVFTGTASSATANFIELRNQDFDALIASSVGGKIEGSTSDVYGVGEDKLYQSLNDLGGMLILRPIRLDGKQNYTRDFVYYNSAPKPQSINYTGGDAQGLTVEFTAYLDNTVDTKVNLYSIGDWTQKEVKA